MAISRINHTQVSNDFIETHMKNLSGGAIGDFKIAGNTFLKLF